MDDSTDPPSNTAPDVMEVSPNALEPAPLDPSPDDPESVPTPAPTPSPTPHSAGMDTDDNRDTEFVYVLRRYNQIPETKVYSPWHIFGGFRWRLLIFPKGNQSSSHDLSVYLECGGPSSRVPGAQHFGTAANGKETVVAGMNSSQLLSWNRPAKFSLHLVHPKSPIGKAHLESPDPAAALSDVDVVENGMSGTRGDMYKETSHTFRENASDWGFLEFASFQALQPGQYADDEMNVVIMVRIRLQDNLNDNMFNNAVTWDSRKETGFVGFKNQGATCYMNSLLQTLYMVSAFRKAVYNMPIPDEGSENLKNELSYALQKVFYELQFSPTVVKTKKLTESFGWDTTDAFTQHDVQELKLILCDELAEKMKKIAPDVPNTISTLFQGKLLNYIECVNVDYKSTREEDFSDLSLNVKGCRNVYESFEKYIEVEMMDGDNKYRADGYDDLQDARKGVKFLKLPPVLQLHLKRFEYDFQRLANVKINDRYEFEKEIDLSRYVENSDGSDIYVLHSVLVHIGDVNGGHYHVFIRPNISAESDTKKPDQWFKFDDESVQHATEDAAISDNFGYGGERDLKREEDLVNGNMNGQIPPPSVFQTRNRSLQARRISNAYMLQYLRKSEIAELLKPPEKSDVPKELSARINKEIEEEEQKQKERAEQHLYMNIAIAVDENMAEHRGSDLVQWDRVRQLRVKRALLLGELKQRLEKEGIVKDARHMRLWRCAARRNDTIRPDTLVANGVDSDPISDPNTRDPLTHAGYTAPLYSGRLNYYGHEDVVRMYAEDFYSPYCLGAGKAQMKFLGKRGGENGGHVNGNRTDVESASEMETDSVYATSPTPSFKLGNKEVLLFLKYYSPRPFPRLQWLGHFVADRTTTIRELHPLLKKALDAHRARDPTLPGVDDGFDVSVYEEVHLQSVVPLDDTKTLEDHRIPLDGNAGVGDVLVFQQNLLQVTSPVVTEPNGLSVSHQRAEVPQFEGFEWDGTQETSRGDGTDLPLGGRPLPTVIHYFDYLGLRIKIEFKDKASVGTPDERQSLFFEVLRRDNYVTLRKILANYLKDGTDSNFIRFFAHDQTRDTAANEPIQLRDHEEIHQVLPIHTVMPTGQPEYRVFWYERTEYHISEFDTKKEIRVVWRADGGTLSTPYAISGSGGTAGNGSHKSGDQLSSSMENMEKMTEGGHAVNGLHGSGPEHFSRGRSISVLVPPNAPYAAVANEVRAKLRVDPSIGIRLYEVKNSKIHRHLNLEHQVPPLMAGTHDIGMELRAEPIPSDETPQELGSDFELVSVLHLSKDKQPRYYRGLSFFGVPFLVKVKKTGEPIKEIRERIRKKLGVPSDEFEKWPLAEVRQLQAEYLQDMDALFIPKERSGMDFTALAVEHKSTAPVKKTTSAISRYADKPLKIRS